MSGSPFAEIAVSIADTLRRRGVRYEPAALAAWCEMFRPWIEDDPDPDRWASGYAEQHPGQGRVIIIGVED
jgi:hypothetical protein